MSDNAVDIKALNEHIEKESAFIDILTLEMNKVIVGQHQMVERLLIGLLGQGHILLEGVPGLAKTLAINTLSKAVKGSFSRIQFTPDLLPADVIGTMIYNAKENDFSIKKGPVFANFVLADEINRAPAKVQSALLEAMQEKQVTIGDETFKLKPPFLVMATQNPVEQEGTYPLPEAQVDRFMLKVIIDYPNLSDEQEIVRANLNDSFGTVKPVISTAQISKAQSPKGARPKERNANSTNTAPEQHQNNTKITPRTPRIQNRYTAALVFHATDRLTCEFQYQRPVFLNMDRLRGSVELELRYVSCTGGWSKKNPGEETENQYYCYYHGY